MAGIEGGDARASLASEGRSNDGALADTARALFVNLCAGFAARASAEAFPAEKFLEAKVELDAIRASLEEATNRILDAGTDIDAIAETVDEKTRDRLAAATATIFEAMGFQDLTGQRMSKVERILIDLRASSTGDAPTPGTAEGDDALLHGPQLPADAIDQDEIDAILAGGG
ncbi:MAG: hypothetical protein ACTSXZ_00045 [Alphaproteobacteria bacterium]